MEEMDVIQRQAVREKRQLHRSRSPIDQFREFINSN